MNLKEHIRKVLKEETQIPFQVLRRKHLIDEMFEDMRSRYKRLFCNYRNPNILLGILYERTLLVKGTDKASPTVGVEHKSYHVYGKKTVDGITYELQSREDGYEKVIIELMAKSIKSFKGINKSK